MHIKYTAIVQLGANNKRSQCSSGNSKTNVRSVPHKHSITWMIQFGSGDKQKSRIISLHYFKQTAVILSQVYKIGGGTQILSRYERVLKLRRFVIRGC